MTVDQLTQWIQSIFDIKTGTILFLGIIFLSLQASFTRKLCLKYYATAFGAKCAMFLDSKLMFIGVVHHELSHALFAVLTGAKLKKVRLFKLNTKDGRLGYVEFIPRGRKLSQLLQKGLTSIAPIIMGSCTLIFLFEFLRENNDFSNFRVYIILIVALHIANHTAMSKQDWKVSAPALPFLYLLTCFLPKLCGFTVETVINYLILMIGLLLVTCIPPLFASMLFRKPNRKVTFKK